jgi:hypothetical protein
MELDKVSDLVEPFQGGNSKSDSLPLEVQRANLKAGLRRLSNHFRESPDTEFLEDYFAQYDLPESDVALRVCKLMLRYNSEFVRFGTNGLLIDPLPQSEETLRAMAALAHLQATMLLEKYLNRSSVMAGFSEKEIAIINVLSDLDKTQAEEGLTEVDIQKASKIPQSTLYKSLKKLRDVRGVLDAIPGKTSRDPDRYRLREEAFKDSEFHLPSLADFQGGVLGATPSVGRPETSGEIGKEAASSAL